MVNTARGVLRAVSLDLGLGVIPRHLLEGASRTALHVVPTKGNALVNSVCLIQLAARIPNEAEKALARFFMNELK